MDQTDNTESKRGRRQKSKPVDGDSPWYKKFLVPAIIVVLTTVTGSLITAYFNGAFRGNTMRASLNKPGFESNVTLRDYLKQLRGASLNSYSEEQLSSVGYVVHVRVELEGLKGKPCSIRGSFMEREKNARLPMPFPWTGQDFGSQLTAERITDAATAFVWLPDLKIAKPFYIQIQAFDPNGTLLDTTDTETINAATPTPTPADRKGKK